MRGGPVAALEERVELPATGIGQRVARALDGEMRPERPAPGGKLVPAPRLGTDRARRVNCLARLPQRDSAQQSHREPEPGDRRAGGVGRGLARGEELTAQRIREGHHGRIGTARVVPRHGADALLEGGAKARLLPLFTVREPDQTPEQRTVIGRGRASPAPAARPEQRLGQRAQLAGAPRLEQPRALGDQRGGEAGGSGNRHRPGHGLVHHRIRWAIRWRGIH